MPPRTLTALLHELYRRLHGRDPDPATLAAIAEARADNGLDDDAQVPSWLGDALAAALDGREVDRVRFRRIGSDVSSFVMDLAEIVPGLQHHDEGEWLTLSMPAVGVRIVLSREARMPDGTGGASYSVQSLPPA
jgi:hypothetical protein